MKYTYYTPVTDNFIVLGNECILNVDEILLICFSNTSEIEIFFKNGCNQIINATPSKLKEYRHIIITYYNTYINKAGINQWKKILQKWNLTLK